MNVLEIIAALVLLVISTIIIINKPKISSTTDTKISPTKTSNPETPKPALNSEDNAEYTAKSHANLTENSQTIENCSLPQDSVLRRHYLTHVNSMIEVLAPPRPTESVLCRHHESMLAAKLEQCLNDQLVMAKLTDDYYIEATNKQQRMQKKVFSPNEVSYQLPEESVLRRHYLTHLYSLIEAESPIRPTESVLCRHYDAMIAAKLVQRLKK